MTRKFVTASASRCTASARSRATCTTTPTCGRCPVRQRAGAPKLDVWLAPPGGWTDAHRTFEPRTFTRFMCKPRAAGWYVAPAVRGAVKFFSHFIGVAKGLDRGTRGVCAGHSGHGGGAGALLERFVWGTWAGAGALLALGVCSPCRSGFGFEPRRCCWGFCWCCVGGVVWLNRQSVAPPTRWEAEHEPGRTVGSVLLLVCAAIL